MEITIKGNPEEIAALVAAIQERQEIRLDSRIELDDKQVSQATERYMRDICAESQP